MNMKSLLGAVLALILAVGGTAYLAARGARPEVPPPNEMPETVDDQAPENPFDLGAPGPKAKLVVPETHFEFGAMELGKEMSHDFEFKNEGEAPLRVAKGPLMCKCTLPLIPNQEVAPGESIKIKLTWKPTEMSVEFNKEAVIWTNDPLNPKINLSVLGQVFADPLAVPTEFALGSVSWNKESEHQMVLMSPISDDMKIESAEVSDPSGMKVTYASETVDGLKKAGISTPPPKSGYILKLTMIPNGQVGPFSGWIKLKLNRGNGEFKANVTGMRAGPLQIHASDYQAALSMIDLKRFKSTEGKVARLFVSLEPTGQDLLVNEVISESGNLTATLKKEKSSGAKEHYVLSIEAHPGITPGTVFSFQKPDTLTLKTNHPKVPELIFKAKYIVN